MITVSYTILENWNLLIFFESCFSNLATFTVVVQTLRHAQHYTKYKIFKNRSNPVHKYPMILSR